MKKKIEKMLFHMLLSTPASKAVLGHEIAAKFSSMIGGDINDHKDELNLLLEELEEKGFMHTETLPNGNLRVVRGVNFNSWSP